MQLLMHLLKWFNQTIQPSWAHNTYMCSVEHNVTCQAAVPTYVLFIHAVFFSKMTTRLAALYPG